jgi:outer membrane lipoprotein-sorting protein
LGDGDRQPGKSDLEDLGAPLELAEQISDLDGNASNWNEGKIMALKKSLILMAVTAFFALPGRFVLADDLQNVLKELDASAAKFHATTADFEFDSYVTEPIPDKQVMTGTAYYQRKGSTFSMAAHVKQQDGNNLPKTYMFTGGRLQLFDPGIDQITIINRATQFESYIMLGFGASGTELADKWTIKDDGPETLNNIKTEKLELVAKDPTVRKTIAKVTVWLDTSRAVSLKQIFDLGNGASRVCAYSNINVNPPSLPADAFKFKTDGKTTTVTQ